MTTHIIQAISGGMDSTCLLLHHLARSRSVHLMSFDYGQKHVLELERLDANLKYIGGVIDLEPDLIECSVDHVRLNVPFGGFATSALTTPGLDIPTGHYADANMKATVVPNRNAIFASFLFAKALAVSTDTGMYGPGDGVSISLGVHAGDHDVYPDCRPAFWVKLLDVFAEGNWGGDAVELDVPYVGTDKEGILRGALDDCLALGLDFDTVLGNTSTSYAPTADGLADGKTGSDVERILAFHAIGRRDPVEYVGGWDAALAYALEAQAAFEEEPELIPSEKH